MRRVPLTRPSVGEAELSEVAAVLASGHLTQGPKVEEFEAAVATVAGTRHAIATTSATTALHLTLAALRIGPADDVLVPDYTFPATANVVIQMGARPVLVDIDPSTFTIDPADLARKVTKASRVVIPVHAFGLAADMDAVNHVAATHGLQVVEDAACALGTTYRGRPVGGLGVAGCFSFHPRKSITTGEGGMVTTNNGDLAATLRRLRSHGSVREGNRSIFVETGFNYRLSDILAGVGVAQLTKLDHLLERRRAIARRYDELFASDPRVVVPRQPGWGGHVYQSYVVLLASGINRDLVIRQLATEGIETTLGTYSLHREPVYRQQLGATAAQTPRSAEVFGRALTLPLYPDMDQGDIRWVVERTIAALDSQGSAVPASTAGGLAHET